MEKSFYEGYKPKSFWINKWHLENDYLSKKRPLEITQHIITKKKKLSPNVVQIIKRTIKHEITIETAMEQTNYTWNYLRKLQKELVENNRISLREPLLYNINGKQLHIIFDENDTMLMLRNELYPVLQIYSSMLDYWIRKLNITGIKTNSNFLLMCECRKIFPGRATYTLYSLNDISKLLLSVFESKKIKNCNKNNLEVLLGILIELYNSTSQTEVK